jgi:hypothetical protein
MRKVNMPITRITLTLLSPQPVLKYLEGIQSASQADDDFVDRNAATAWGRASTGAKSPAPIHSPTPKSQHTNSNHLEKLAESRVSYSGQDVGLDDKDDVASNEQDGQRSELGIMQHHPVVRRFL